MCPRKMVEYDCVATKEARVDRLERSGVLEKVA